MAEATMKIVLSTEEIGGLIDFIEAAKATDPQQAEHLITKLKERSTDTPLLARIRHEAKQHHEQEGEVEFDDECTVSIEEGNQAPDGAYVQAWVWVGNPDLEDPEPFKFPGLDCEVIGLKVGKYSGNGAMAVAAILKWANPEPGDEPIEDHVVSVNVAPGADVVVPSDLLPEGEFYLKAWSENANLAEALIARGIIEPAGNMAVCGYCTASSYRITPKGLKWTQVMEQ